jgi:hypothetical protein
VRGPHPATALRGEMLDPAGLDRDRFPAFRRVLAGLPPGTYDLEMDHGGFVGEAKGVHVEEGRITTTELVLRRSSE